jgi:hypothetical protein
MQDDIRSCCRLVSLLEAAPGVRGVLGPDDGVALATPGVNATPVATAPTRAIPRRFLRMLVSCLHLDTACDS